MTHILLTHGYFLSEDEKERQIMKPYPPLGLLYLSAYLKSRDHSVEVYDSTFGTRPELEQKIRRSPGSLVGIYTNLMTRRSVLQIIRAARESDSTVILGGPESANYSSEYLQAGADVVTAERPKINDLDSMPMADREAIDHGKYLDAWRQHHVASSINLSTA